MDCMFRGCSGLTALDLSHLDTRNVTSMTSMFYDCSGLTTLDLSSLNTQKVMDMGYMFSGCTSLTTLNLSFLDTQKVTGMSRMFDDCDKLTSLSLGEKFAFVGSNYYLSEATALPTHPTENLVPYQTTRPTPTPEDRLENQNSLTNKHTCLNLKIAHRCVSLVYNPHFRYIKTQAIFLQLASSQI